MLFKAIFLIMMTGIASQYAPGKMESVINVRQTPGRTAYTVSQNINHYDGFMAMENCQELGNEYYARPVGTINWELFLVVDCSGHSETTQWMLRNNIIAEVDYETAKRWNTIGRGIKIELSTKRSSRFVPQ